MNILDAGWAYDNAGNITTDSVGEKIGYDAENRQVAFCPPGWSGTCVSSPWTSQTVYQYDGDGHRVRRIDINGVQTTFVYGADGALAMEYTTAASGLTPSRQYLTDDQLGTTRAVTGAAGVQPEFHDYKPFGEEIQGSAGGWRTSVPQYSGLGDVRLKFTGKERDAETGLDYFGARYFSSAQGRFTSPDKPFADQHQDDPQTWNLYSYVRNNPLKFVDSTGTDLRLAANATKQERKDFAAAQKYLSKDVGEKAILNTLQQSATVYTVTFNNNGDDSFDPNTNTVSWDPRSALATQDNAGMLNGGTQTPALGLGHELDHAAGKDQGTTAHGADAQYDNAEERRVITGSETAAAGTVHEATRTNHGGAPYESKSPTSRKPTKQGTQDLRKAEHDRGQDKQKYKTNGN